jgi:zinc protease
VPIEKLREFYDTYYWPNNATISIIGDFDPVTSLELIKKFNGSIPRSPKPIPEIYTDEPPQTGPRRVTVKRPGQVPVMAIGYKIVAATHPDYPALNVLSVILAHGKNSRLYKALTDKKLTLGVSAYAGFNRDPSLELVTASLSPGASKEEVETITLSEIEKIKKDGVSEAELQAALAKMKAGVAFQRDGSYVIAGSLAENIAAGDWTTFYSLVESTMAVTTADVRRVANKYLNVDQSTTGWYLPTGEGVGAPSAAKPELSPENSGPKPKFLYDPDLPAEPTESGASSAVRETSVANLKIAPKIVRATIVTMDVLVMKTGVKDVATLRAYLPAGRAHGAGGNPVIPTLTSMMLDQGTTKHDKFEVAELLESVGATLGFSSGAQTVNVGAKCLAKDVPLVLSLIAEQLRTPAFSAEEFAKAKTQLSGSIKRSLEDTNSRARSAFHRAIYPVGDPNYSRPPEELLAAIESATLDEVKAFHAKFYGPAHMVLVAVGDVDAEQIKAQVAKNFAGWSGGTEMVSAPAVTATKSVTEQSVPMPDKTSVSLIVGQASGLRYRDPDYQALSVATAILGSGWTSRLMSTVREKEGLSYGIGSGLSNDAVTEGEWSIYGTFAPALLSKGIASTRDQLSKWYSEGVSAEEIANRKSNIIGSYKVALTTTDGLASAILGTVYCGLDPTWIDELPSRIEALTPDQINDAIKKYLNPDRMVIIKAGTIPPATSPRK